MFLLSALLLSPDYWALCVRRQNFSRLYYFLRQGTRELCSSLSFLVAEMGWAFKRMRTKMYEHKFPLGSILVTIRKDIVVKMVNMKHVMLRAELVQRGSF
jgi:hypothetical protein